MTGTEGHDHADTRYLDAKATVDDRALDRRVADRLREELPPSPTVFDAGCGTGVTLPRLREWGVEPAGYRGVDTDAGLVAAARERHAADTVSFAVGDAVAAAREAADGSFDPDLAVAGSFLDLVPVGEAVDTLAAAVGPGGLVYAPFTFDGRTTFAPAHPADDLVERIYHETIDAQPGRNVRAGRAAVDHCRRADGQLLAVGASDWVVRANDDGYPNDERYFLSCILGFVADALFVDGGDGEGPTDSAEAESVDADPTDRAGGAVADADPTDRAGGTVADADPTDRAGGTVADADPTDRAGGTVADADPTDRAATALTDTDHTAADLRDWLQCRRRQAEAGELVYTASQFDVLYRA
ncbi:class I SAM-dependent methyltransferase [Halobaculum sp. MBLA0143]|uniref:class I SAM-dependent methyltransferase n=1 Tax=Halobaculum sp. MBLA0143 TaxID=3079933 RepID=UPI0035259616